MSVYYNKRFISLIEVIESRWGGLVPDDMESGKTEVVEQENKEDEDKKGESNDDNDEKMKKRRSEFLACMFIEGADRSKYGRCIADMNINYLSGNDLYPKRVVAAMTSLLISLVVRREVVVLLLHSMETTEHVTGVERKDILQQTALRTR